MGYFIDELPSGAHAAPRRDARGCSTSTRSAAALSYVETALETWPRCCSRTCPTSTGPKPSPPATACWPQARSAARCRRCMPRFNM
jgi:hypothetical protein